MARAASCISLASASGFKLLGFISMAILLAFGTNSRRSSSRFGPSVMVKNVTPVHIAVGAAEIADQAWSPRDQPASGDS